MTSITLEKEKILYQHALCYKGSQKYGSQKIIKDFLGITHSFDLPLGISHGVDFNHLDTPQDIDDIAPIHWSYNEEIHHRAKNYKHSLLIPHPFSLISKSMPKTKSQKNGYLMIAPPGSAANNEKLLKIINEQFSDLEVDILIKGRGIYSEDEMFWHSHGHQTITAGNGGPQFYKNLHKIFSLYNSILGCTASSALIFASALGKESILITDYTFNVNEVANYDINFNNSWAKDFFKYLVDLKFDEANSLAREKLGFNLDHDVENLSRSIFNKINEIDNFLYCTPGLSENKFKQYLFRVSGKKFFLSKNIFFAILKKLKKQKILKVSKNEIDIVLNTKNSDNYKEIEVLLNDSLSKPGTGF